MSAAEPVSRVPPAAGVLGGLGLIPFVAGTALVLLSDAPWAVDALRFYAAAILSFLGGVHWGLGIAGRGTGPSWLRLGGSVVPSLVAWLALLLAPMPGLLLAATAFCLLLAADLLAVAQDAAPRWYPRLRVPLTAVVVPCLVVAALG